MSLLLYSLSVRRPPRPCCRDVKSRCRLRPSRCFWYNSRIPSIEHRDAKRNPKWITTTRGSARRKRFYSAWSVSVRGSLHDGSILVHVYWCCTPHRFWPGSAGPVRPNFWVLKILESFSLKKTSMAIFDKSLSNLATEFSSVKWYKNVIGDYFWTFWA